MNRRTVGVAIVGLWIAGLAWLGHRLWTRSDAERFAEVAMRVEPSGVYYRVYQGDSLVGFASSTIDTVERRLRITEFFSGRLIVAGDSQDVRATAIAYVSPRFALDSFALTLGGDAGPWQRRGAPKSDSVPVFTPTQALIAFMLSGDEPEIGREERLWMYNPVADDVQRGTLRIMAESLFTVADSAAFDTASGRWIPAHTDTVRAWSVAPPSSGFTVWVDAQGRLVRASEPGGLRAERTAYEIASENWRIQHPPRGRRR